MLLEAPQYPMRQDHTCSYVYILINWFILSLPLCSKNLLFASRRNLKMFRSDKLKSVFHFDTSKLGINAGAHSKNKSKKHVQCSVDNKCIIDSISDATNPTCITPTSHSGRSPTGDHPPVPAVTIYKMEQREPTRFDAWLSIPS